MDLWDGFRVQWLIELALVLSLVNHHASLQGRAFTVRCTWQHTTNHVEGSACLIPRLLPMLFGMGRSLGTRLGCASERTGCMSYGD